MEEVCDLRIWLMDERVMWDGLKSGLECVEDKGCNLKGNSVFWKMIFLLEKVVLVIEFIVFLIRRIIQ